MQNKGNILLILLIMLLFASAALLQLNEDNYFTHLIAKQVDYLSNARKNLNQAFKVLLKSPSENQACFTNANTKIQWEDFWSVNSSCKIQISDASVYYALQRFEQGKKEEIYEQYTLCIKTNVTSMWLKIFVETQSGVVTSWVYDIE